MPEFLTSSPLWLFIICLLGAVFTWFAADHFRDQIVGDTHKLVRMVALRYLQVMIGLFTVFILGILWSMGSFARQAVGTIGATPLPTETPTPTITPTLAPGSAPPPTAAPDGTLPDTPADGGYPEPDAVPTLAPTALPTPDPTLSAVRTAVIVNTNEVGVNLRNAPSLNDSIVLLVIPEDTRITLLEDVVDAEGFVWQKIIAPDGQEGWVATIFLDYTDEQ